jgi:hypothetical protein
VSDDGIRGVGPVSERYFFTSDLLGVGLVWQVLHGLPWPMWGRFRARCSEFLPIFAAPLNLQRGTGASLTELHVGLGDHMYDQDTASDERPALQGTG